MAMLSIYFRFKHKETMEDPDKLIENGCVICREFHTEK